MDQNSRHLDSPGPISGAVTGETPQDQTDCDPLWVKYMHPRNPEGFDGPAIYIQDVLQDFNLPHWGFVMIRCTYRSQEKWDKFVAIAQRHAREYFESCEMLSVYDRMKWTVIEDAATLDGADILQTSRRFKEWVGTNSSWHSPRNDVFLHVDEESLESVVDDAKAREQGGYSCKIVRADVVLNDENAELVAQDREEVRAALAAEGVEVEMAELWEFRKRVKIDDLVLLYADLQCNLDGWYDSIMDGEIVVV